MELPVKVGKSPTLHIRGVLATQFIPKGTIIESCPVIIVDRKQEAYLRKTVLWKYYFEWSREYHCIVLGYGSLYNHSFRPNADYSFDYRNERMTIKALRNIQAGEEIFLNYNGDPTSKEKLDPMLIDFDRHRKRAQKRR